MDDSSTAMVLVLVLAGFVLIALAAWIEHLQGKPSPGASHRALMKELKKYERQ